MDDRKSADIDTEFHRRRAKERTNRLTANLCVVRRFLVFEEPFSAKRFFALLTLLVV
jgi:hypothetical protein